MEHQVDLGDVQSTGRDVRGHEHRRAAGPEAREHPLALGLGHVAVQRLARHVQRHGRSDLIAIPLGLREHDGLAPVGVHGDQVDQNGPPRRARHLHAVRRDVLVELSRRALADVIDVDRVLQVLVDERLDPLGDGGREHHRLPLLGHKLEDILHVLLEPNVEHLVGLVEHHKLDIREIQRPLLDEINHTPGRSHRDIDTTLQHPLLRHDARAAVEASHKEVTCNGLHLAFHLLGQLPRRGQHDALRRAPPRLALAAERVLDPLDDGQGEGQRLSASGLGTRDDVPSRLDRLEHELLDGEQRLDAARLEQLDHLVLHAAVPDEQLLGNDLFGPTVLAVGEERREGRRVGRVVLDVRQLVLLLRVLSDKGIVVLQGKVDGLKAQRRVQNLFRVAEERTSERVSERT